MVILLHVWDILINDIIYDTSRQLHTIWQEAPAKDFGAIQSFENEGILCVFPIFKTAEVGQKIGCGPQTQLCGVAFQKRHAVRQDAPNRVPGIYLVFSGVLRH